jgi:hypothetical protein
MRATTATFLAGSRERPCRTTRRATCVRSNSSVWLMARSSFVRAAHSRRSRGAECAPEALTAARGSSAARQATPRDQPGCPAALKPGAASISAALRPLHALLSRSPGLVQDARSMRLATDSRLDGPGRGRCRGDDSAVQLGQGCCSHRAGDRGGCFRRSVGGRGRRGERGPRALFGSAVVAGAGVGRNAPATRDSSTASRDGRPPPPPWQRPPFGRKEASAVGAPRRLRWNETQEHGSSVLLLDGSIALRPALPVAGPAAVRPGQPGGCHGLGAVKPEERVNREARCTPGGLGRA